MKLSREVVSQRHGQQCQKCFDNPGDRPSLVFSNTRGIIVVINESTNAVIYLQSECFEECQFKLCSKYCGEIYDYACLSILLATFNCRARGKFGPSTLNYLLNGVANA